MSDLDKFNYECEDQIDIFDLIRKPISITKPIRLIELFAGYGSQAMALRDIGAKFEHYRVVEFDKYAIASYNAVHGTDFPTMDITKVHASDLNICDTEKYCYFMTYSFPCTDLSVAGKQAGMKKGSGTRIGGCFDASYHESTTRRGRVQDKGNICPTLTAQNQEIVRIESKYRIRKFTPRECGRLMGVSDEDISKMEKVNSDTQLYKQFGNSIVVNVMRAMFKNLNIDQ